MKLSSTQIHLGPAESPFTSSSFKFLVYTKMGIYGTYLPGPRRKGNALTYKSPWPVVGLSETQPPLLLQQLRGYIWLVEGC